MREFIIRMNILAPDSPDRPREFVSWTRDRWMFEEGGVVMLMYHKIAPAPASTNLPMLYVHPKEFDRQMAELTGAGLSCIPYGEVVDTIGAGKGGFCVTFDDGFRNVFEQALPVLQKRGLRAIQFIVAGLIGGEDAWDRAIGEPPQALMDEGMIREWLAAGHEIGSHTLTHPHLPALPREQAWTEIFDSRRRLEDRFGVPIKHFCYPYGDNDEAVREMVREAGYETAPTVAFGTNLPGVDPRGLNRVIACEAPSMFGKVKRKVARLVSSGR